MAIIEIDGVGKVEVSDSFKAMSPEQQGALVNNIVAEFKSGKKSSMGASAPPAVGRENWTGELATRQSAIEETVKNSGPYRPQDIAAARLGNAVREGQLFGQQNKTTQGKQSAAIGVNNALDTMFLGLPTMTRAAMAGGDVPFAERHEFMKAANAAQNRENPIASTAGQIAGIAGQVATLPVSGAPTVLGRVATGATQAGLLSGGEALVESRGDLRKGAEAAGYGLLLGGGLGLGIEGAIKGGRAAFNPLMGIARSADDPGQAAAARLMMAAQKEKLDPSQVSAKVAALGPEGVVGDVLGQQGTALGRTASNVSPEARGLLSNFATERVGNQFPRLSQSLEDVANRLPGNATQPWGLPRVRTGDTAEGLKEAAYARAQPGVNAAYDAAYKAGYAQDAAKIVGDDLMQLPRVKAAWEQAVREVRERIAVGGPNEGSQLAIVNAMSKILNEQGYQQGDDLAKRLGALLRARADAAVPEFGGARKAAQAYKQEQEAIDLGAAMARPQPKMADITAAGNATAPGPMGQAWTLEKLQQLAQANKAGQSGINIVEGSPATQAARRVALGQQGSDDIANAVSRERQFLNFKNEITGNSTTARQLMEMAGAASLGGLGGMAAGFDPAGAASLGGALAMARSGGKKLMEASRKNAEAKIAPEIAKGLLEKSLPALTKTETERRLLIESLLRRMAPVGGLLSAQ